MAISDEEILRRAFRSCIDHGTGTVRQCLAKAEGDLAVARLKAARKAGLREDTVRKAPRTLGSLWDEVNARIAAEERMRERFNTVYIHPRFRRGTRTSRRQARRMHVAYELPSRNVFGPAPLAGLGARLTARARASLPSSSFALPGRRYPLPDCSHARNALSRASMSYHRGHLSQKEHATVVRKAHAAMRRLCN